jgi:hypothetical protein
MGMGCSFRQTNEAARNGLPPSRSSFRQKEGEIKAFFQDGRRIRVFTDVLEAALQVYGGKMACFL